MTPKAQRCIDWTVAREGGYVNHPRDPGGETKFGISKRAHPTVDIKNLTRDQAVEIYRTEYWNKVYGDLFEEPLALALFDYAVHSGPTAAWGELCELLGMRHTSPMDEVAERIAETEEDPKELAKRLVLQRATFLLRRALLKPNQEVFLIGWMQRMRKLKQAIEAMA